jgi:hypothetical protein
MRFSKREDKFFPLLLRKLHSRGEEA